MPAAFYDFFRKINLKYIDGSSVIQPDFSVEADSTVDELNIIRGAGVNFGSSDPDSFKIDVEYDLSVPLGTTAVRLTDINNNVSDLNFVAGNNITLTRVDANNLRIDSADLTIVVNAISTANPSLITTATPHGLLDGAVVTFADTGIVTLDDNQFYADVSNTTQFTIYTDSGLTTPVDGSGFSYTSGGSIQVESVDTLSILLDVNIPNSQDNDILNYNATESKWENTSTPTFGTATATTGFIGNIDGNLTGGIISENTASTILDTTAATAMYTGDVTGRADTADAWHTARTFSFGGGDVSGFFTTDGSADINNIQLTIGANSVLLGTDTVGQYAKRLAVSGVGLSATTPETDDATEYTITSNATNAATADTIVSRDANSDFAANMITSDLTGDVIGNVDGNLTGGVISENTSSTILDTTGAVAVYTGNVTGNADTASALSSAVTVTLTGDVAGTATFTSAGDTASIAATIQADSVALGTDTTGNYVRTITGTANEIAVANSGTEDADIVLSLPSDVTIANDLTVTNNLIVSQNLTVSGTTTTVNSNEVNIGDSIILLNSDETGTPSQNGGIEIERGTSDNARFIWDETNDTWSPQLFNTTWQNTTLTASEFIGPLTGAVTGNADTASKWQTARSVNFGTGDVSGSFTIDGDNDINDIVLTVADNSHNHVSTNISDFQEAVTDTVGAMVSANTESGGIDVSFDDATDKLNFQLSTVNLTLTNTVGVGVTGSATIDLSESTINLETEFNGQLPLGTSTSGNYVEDFSVTSGTGISVTGESPAAEGNNITIAGIDATNTVKGVASFDATDFLVSSGAVSLVHEAVEDIVGEMVSGNTEGGISVTYDDTANKLNFDVNNTRLIFTMGGATVADEVVSPGVDTTIAIARSPTITVSGAVAGTVELTNLGSASLSTTMTSNLDDINDVNVTNPTDGYFLQWNNSAGEFQLAAVGGVSVPTLDDVLTQGATSAITTTLSNTTSGGSGAGLVVEEISATGTEVNFTKNIDAGSNNVTATQFIGEHRGDVAQADGTTIIDATAGTMDWTKLANVPTPVYAVVSCGTSAFGVVERNGGTVDTIPFDTVDSQNSTDFDTSTYTYTTPVAGVYRVMMNVYTKGVVADGGTFTGNDTEYFIRTQESGQSSVDQSDGPVNSTAQSFSSKEWILSLGASCTIKALFKGQIYERSQMTITKLF